MHGICLKMQVHACKDGAAHSWSLLQPAGTFALTPASKLSAAAVYALSQKGVLSGKGIDWGCGNGVLSVIAASAPSVSSILGLDIEEPNVRAARENGNRNGSACEFIRADSFSPLEEDVRVF